MADDQKADPAEAGTHVQRWRQRLAPLVEAAKVPVSAVVGNAASRRQLVPSTLRSTKNWIVSVECPAANPVVALARSRKISTSAM